MERITYQDTPKGMYEKLRAIEEIIHASSLEFNLIELIKFRVSQLNGCAYCLDMHYKELKKSGETDLRISLLAAWEESGFFNEKESAALQYAEALTIITHKPLSNAVFEMLDRYFSKQEIAYLSLVITQINTWNRLMKAFKTPAGNYEPAS